MHYVSWIAERSDFMKQKTVLGIDIGGTKVGIGLVTNKGKIWDSLRYPQRYCDIEDLTEELSE